ncbi:MAG: hypothetical protein INF55_15600 [Roseomonas sp.]|nr:hypothetical protein [Roseomonas sp.]MCA3584699.1 hypothetical protein [Methylocystis sp.]
MSLLLATIRGDLRAAMEAEIRDVARAMRRGVERAGREVQAELRAQARGAGFSDKGRALANSWRLKLYPPPGAAPRSFRPAALVYSNAPKLVEAFDKGIPIAAKGGRYLAFPTGYNATRGRRGASSRGGLRVTPAEMTAARGEAFVISSKSNPAVRLWCLRVRGASGLGKRRRLRLFAGANVEVLTGHRRGQQRLARATLAQGFVPMFFLMRQVRLAKRLDVAGVRRRAGNVLARAIVAELARDA